MHGKILETVNEFRVLKFRNLITEEHPKNCCCSFSPVTCSKADSNWGFSVKSFYDFSWCSVGVNIFLSKVFEKCFDSYKFKIII